MMNIPGLKLIRMDYSTNPPSGIFEVIDHTINMITIQETGEVLYANPKLEELANMISSQAITKAKGE